jgi:hypothetical protein
MSATLWHMNLQDSMLPTYNCMPACRSVDADATGSWACHSDQSISNGDMPDRDWCKNLGEEAMDAGGIPTT